MSIRLAAGTTQISAIVGLFDSTGAAITGKNTSSFQTPVLVMAGSGAASILGTITLATTLAATNSAFTAGGLVEFGAGRYRLDFTTSGAAGAYTLAAEGTVGSMIVDSFVVADSASLYGGASVIVDNATSMRTANVLEVGGTMQTARDLGANLDVTVSSRLATTGYTTPPTASAIRIEMDANSTKLANLDTTVGSRLATLGANAPIGWLNAAAFAAASLNGKGDWLTVIGYTTPPTVAQIRTEMDANSTKLANLDVTVGSRLATTGYTAPDNTGIASAVTQATAAAGNTASLPSMIAGGQFTVSALANAPAGGGGGTTNNVQFTVTEMRPQ